jgi:UDPglucose--hexose-1-phosphate uridylyltransferase
MATLPGGDSSAETPQGGGAAVAQVSGAESVRSRLKFGADATKARTNFLKGLGLNHLVERKGEGSDGYGLEALVGKHFRCEVATGVWSLHSPKPHQKPRGYLAKTGGDPRTHERPDTKKDRNPFDLENSHMTPPVLHAVPDPEDASKPMIRVFENKFPVLTAPEDRDNIDIQVSFVDGILPQVSAIGLHEVVVQHWRYNMCECLMTVAEIKLLWKALFDRFTELTKVSRFVQLMENHGQRSGGSLPHPHAQVLGLPVVPGEQTRRYSIALEYWRTHAGKNVFEEIMAKTIAHTGDVEKDRMLLQNDAVVAFVPHAQERANEIWIVPRRQCHSFALATEAEVEQLALAARSCLGMLYAAHDDPDYNILMRSAPCNPGDAPGDSETEPIAEWYRWHLVIIPHAGEWGGIKGYGGFSEVSGTPEQHARTLRAARGVNLKTGEMEADAFVDALREEAPSPSPQPSPQPSPLGGGGLVGETRGAGARRLSRQEPQGFKAAFLADAGLSNLGKQRLLALIHTLNSTAQHSTAQHSSAHSACQGILIAVSRAARSLRLAIYSY